MSPTSLTLSLLAVACASGIASGVLSHRLASSPSPPPPATEDERLRELEERLRSLAEADVERARALERSLDELRSSLAEVERRAVEAESKAAREPLAPPADATRDEPELAPASGEAERGELRAMLAAVLGHTGEHASSADEQRFWELARTGGALAELLVELEAEVESRPSDTRRRLALAQAYVAKLLTVPAGPERGIWGARAEEQWREAARIDPDCWEARFALGENFSYYPPFLNKSGDALDELEAAREIQERRAPEPRFVETYLLLARVHQARGAVEEARAALEAGLAAHPGDASLTAALAALEE